MRPNQPKPEDVDPIGSAVSKARVSRMTEHEIAYMLATSARNPAVYRVAKDRLVSDLFEASEIRYALLWRSVTLAAESTGGALPSDAGVAKELVAVNCSREIASDAGGRSYTPAVEASILDPGGLLDEVFALPISMETSSAVFEMLARFVNERKVVDPIRRALAGISSRDTIQDPHTILAMIESHSRDMVGLGIDPGADAVSAEEDFLPPKEPLLTTGQRWLDEQLGGGTAKKEAYVILGMTSGGKSVLGAQMAVDGAELQAAIAADVGPQEAGHWYIFTWELNLAQLQTRIAAYAARVHLNTLAERDPITNQPNYSTSARPETLKPYEHEPYVNSPGNPIMGEKERLAALRRRMSGSNSRLHIVDYSGQHPGFGVGGVPEVVDYLRRETDKGRKVAGVVFDYAGIAVQRYVSAKNLRPESEYNLLASFVDQVRSRVSVGFDCTSWVLHQLHGDATRRAPGAKIHHSEARGCKNFADNCDFAFCLSPYSKATGLLTVSCTKHRRAPGQEDGAIVHFDGRFGVFRDPDQPYVVDPMTKQIVPRNFMGSGQIVPTAAPANYGFVDPRTIL